MTTTTYLVAELMSDATDAQELDNSVSSQLAGNDIANLYSVINKDR